MISLADQMAASATNFLTGIIIARSCSKEEFGLYMLCFSIVLFVLDVQTSLISSPYMVYSPRLKGRRHAAYIGNSLVQQFMLVVLVLFVLAAGIAITVHGRGPEGLYPVLLSLSLVVWFIMLREFIRRICFAGLEMSTALCVDCTVAVLQVGCLLLLAWSNRLSAGNALYAIGFACTCTSLGWLYFRRKTYTFHTRHIREDFRKNLSFGKWIFASSLLWALSMSLYPWLLAFYHGTASAGTWAACWGIIAIANPLLLGIQNFLGPKIVQAYTRNGRDGLRRFVQRVSLLYGLIILPLAVFLCIFGGKLVALFYGAKYGGNGLVISILAVHLMVMAVSFTLSRALLALEQARAYFMANIVPLLVMLTFGLYLVKELGVAGVALGLLAGTATTAAMMLVLFIRLMKTESSSGAGNG
jgi:O-antigen/teichoic acid export membrane protein